MGLDITVERIVRNVPIQDDDNFYLLKDSPELEKFKDRSFEKINHYYQLEEELLKLGLTFNDIEHSCTRYGENVVFEYRNKIHPLYEIYELISRSGWINNKISDKNILRNSRNYKLFVEQYRAICIKYGWKPKYKRKLHSGKVVYDFCNVRDFITKKITVILTHVPTKAVPEQVIYYEEVGYQRKGANTNFYKKDETGDYIHPSLITSLDELNRTWIDNFSSSEEFRENIVDKFVEGETVVSFSW